MALIHLNARNPFAQYDCAQTRAHEAFSAHKALLEIERMHPELRDNPAWTLLRQDAFENFSVAFDAMT